MMRVSEYRGGVCGLSLPGHCGLIVIVNLRSSTPWALPFLALQQATLSPLSESLVVTDMLTGSNLPFRTNQVNKEPDL